MSCVYVLGNQKPRNVLTGEVQTGEREAKTFTGIAQKPNEPLRKTRIRQYIVDTEKK